MIKYLQLFTELSEKEIQNYKNLSGDEINKAKIKLANEATKLLHGATAAANAEKTSHQTFVNKSTGEELPTKKVNKNEIENGLNFKQVLLEIKFASSGGDFKRNLTNNAYRINNNIENNENKIITTSDIVDNEIKISFGKKKHFVLKII